MTVFVVVGQVTAPPGPKSTVLLTSLGYEGEPACKFEIIVFALPLVGVLNEGMCELPGSPRIC